MTAPGDHPGLALGALIAAEAAQPPDDAPLEPILWDGDYA